MTRHQFVTGLVGLRLVCQFIDPQTHQVCRSSEDDPVHHGPGVPERGEPGYKPPGEVWSITCPFRACSAQVSVRGTRPDYTIFAHTVRGNNTTIPCPASLMSYPTPPAQLEALREVQGPIIKQLNDEVVDEIYRITEPWDMPESQPVKHPGRMGREPSDKASEWQLGGRVDEDVIPVEEQVTGKVPPHVGGQSVGRGSEMASIDESAGMINAAGAAVNEAITGLNDVVESIDRALGSISEVGGQTPGETLQNYLGLLLSAKTNIEAARNDLHGTGELGEAFITRLYS